MVDYINTVYRTLFGRLFALLGTIAVVLFLAQAAGAVTINVTTTDPGVNADGQCSLEEAIDNANDDAATHGDCTAGGGGADVLELANGAVYNLDMVVGSTNGESGLPEVDTVITINGNGATVQRDPANGACDTDEFRIIAVSSTGDLTLNDITLTNGCALGGGDSGLGGAIFVDGGGGILVVNNSTISGNDAGGGGGIYNEGTADIDETTISGNDANNGAGIWNNGGTIDVHNSTISGNDAGVNGGGILNSSNGVVNLNNCTISGNSADDGGGIHNGDFETYNINNCTITNNSATGDGGGIWNDDSGVMNLEHTIIANQNSGADCFDLTSMTITTQGWNLDSDDTCNLDTTCPDLATGPCDQINENPLLGTLQDNGGPTFTHALPLNSPAIDMGDPAGCENTDGANFTRDQRDFPRPVDGDGMGAPPAICDIGAYEASGLADLSIVKIGNPNPVALGGTVTYTVTITNNGPANAIDPGFTDNLPAGTIFVPNSFVLDNDFPDLNENCNHVAGLITCMLNGTLTPAPSPPTDSWTISFQVTAPLVLGGGTISNTSIVTSNQPDDVPGNNNSTAVTTLGEPLPVSCSDVIVSTDPGQCGATVDPTEVFNGALDSLIFDLDPPGPYPLGTTMVILTVFDGEGGFGACEADITVLDGELPVLNNCPEEPIIVETDQEGQQPDNVFIPPTAIDNCDGVLPVVCTHEPDDTFPSGNTTVECTATDDAGNIGVCEFTVSVPGNSGCGCMVAGPIHFGTTAANALLPLIPLLAVGLRAMLRRRRNKG